MQAGEDHILGQVYGGYGGLRLEGASAVLHLGLQAEARLTEGEAARMNKSCCFVLQYNTETLVLVLQYYIGKWAILKQYQKHVFDQSACTAYSGISDKRQKKLKEGEFQINIEVQNILK